MLIKTKVIVLQLNSYHGITINGKHALLKVKEMWRERDKFYFRAIVYLRAKHFNKTRDEKSGDVSKIFLRNFSCLAHFMSLVFLKVSYERFSCFQKVRVRIRRVEMLVFCKILRTYLMDDPRETSGMRWVNPLTTNVLLIQKPVN